MTAKGSQTRDAQWHKRKERKRLKRARIRKSHDIEYRASKGTSIQMSEAEQKYQEAMEKESQQVVSTNWFIRQFIKLKLTIQRLWIKSKLKK